MLLGVEQEEKIAQTLVREILSPAPRPLLEIQAELLFIEGQYLLHYRDEVERGIYSSFSSNSDRETGDNGDGDTGGDAGADRNGGVEHYKFLDVAQLKNAFSFQAVDSQWLSPGTLRWGIGKTGVWVAKYIRPSLAQIEMEIYQNKLTGERRVSADFSGVTSEMWKKVRVMYELPLPAFVFAGVSNKYYIWAVKRIRWEQKGASLVPKAVLYHAPLPNIYENGAICFGANQPPNLSSKDGKYANTLLDETWRIFIGSPFNADLSKGKSKANPSDVRVQLIEIASPVDTNKQINTSTSSAIVDNSWNNTEAASNSITMSHLKYPVNDLVPVNSTTFQRGGFRKISLAETIETLFVSDRGRF